LGFHRLALGHGGWLCGLGPRGRFVHLWQLGCDLFEKLLDIESGLCTDFLEIDGIAFGQVPALGFRDVPLLQVYLVGQQRDDHSFSPLRLHVVHPLLNALERTAVGHVVYDDRH
jgi:hypothetical protein